MVPAGSAVDETLGDSLIIWKGDIVIDGELILQRHHPTSGDTQKSVTSSALESWWRRGSTSWTKYYGRLRKVGMESH